MRTVDKQLSDYMYTFPTVTAGGVKGLPMRHKPYRNKRIVTAIRTLFFTGGTSAYAHRFDSKFPRFRGPDGALVREVPEAMLTLVATALYAAIHKWRTGVHQPTDFSTNAYIDAYNGHVGTLNHLRAQRSGAFHVMMADLYNLARCLHSRWLETPQHIQLRPLILMNLMADPDSLVFNKPSSTVAFLNDKANIPNFRVVKSSWSILIILWFWVLLVVPPDNGHVLCSGSMADA
ncbi:hypothetical protein V8E52_007126 [Russula decolorans]